MIVQYAHKSLTQAGNDRIPTFPHAGQPS